MKLNGEIVYKACNGCGEEKAIVYQKGVLCHYCNQKRLIKIREERKKEKQLKTFEGNVESLKKKYSIKRLSDKEQSRKAKLKALYRLIDKEAIEEGGFYCKGCGRSDRPLSHSHTIPVSQRKDLELDRNNIELECMDWNGIKGCHTIWEHGTNRQKKKLLNYARKVAYIKRIDPGYYTKVFE